LTFEQRNQDNAILLIRKRKTLINWCKPAITRKQTVKA